MPATVEPRPSSISTTGFVDGLGRRSIRFDRELGTTLECLQVRPELRAFEETLLAQACAISDLADTRFMRVRSIDQEHGRLVVISELAPGDRLSDIIESRFPGLNPVSTIDAAFGFLLQMLPALGRLHGASLVHGAVAPGRVVLSNSGRIILTDAIFGTSLTRLNLSRRRLWQELQVAYPAGPRELGADLAQAAMCSLIVALGRPIEVTDALKAWGNLIDEAAAIARARGGDDLATDVRHIFRLLLPASGTPARISADEAIEQIGEIASRHLGEDACSAALLDFVRYDSRAAITTPGGATTAAPVSAPLLAVTAPAVLELVTPAASAVEEVTPKAAAVEDQPVEQVISRSMFGVDATDTGSDEVAATVPFVQRGRAWIQSAPTSWKVAAAAAAVLVIVMAVGVAGGWGSSEGEKPAPAKATAGAAVKQPAAAAPVSPAPPASPTKGIVSITTQPEGAKVLLDGVNAGQTPLRIDNVAPGKHQLVVSTDEATVKRTVRVEAGKTLTLDIPVAAGWIAIKTPLVLDVAADGRSLGTTAQGRISLPPGRHTLTLSNRDVTYSSVHTVEVGAGREEVLNVAPTGRVNLNAQPWAEVWIDGSRAGETPIANLQVPLGTREFVFKHPQYGERRVTAKVSTTPSALSVDFTKSAQQ